VFHHSQGGRPVGVMCSIIVREAALWGVICALVLKYFLFCLFVCLIGLLKERIIRNLLFIFKKAFDFNQTVNFIF